MGNNRRGGGSEGRIIGKMKVRYMRDKRRRGELERK
jgi:hypothetical protein